MKNWKKRSNPYYLRLHFESRPKVHELIYWWAGIHYILLPQGKRGLHYLSNEGSILISLLYFVINFLPQVLKT